MNPPNYDDEPDDVDLTYPREPQENKKWVEVIFTDEPNFDEVNYLLLWILNFGVFIVIPIFVLIALGIWYAKS